MSIKKAKKSNNSNNKSSIQKQAPSKQNGNTQKQTRIEILRTLSESTGLSRVQVETLFNSLSELIISHMRKKGSGEFTIPMTGIKVRRVKKKASKARTMVSPLTGQEVEIAGKPARSAIKISALKVLKSAVVE
jgi:nucleoid DNA-binding protein